MVTRRRAAAGLDNSSSPVQHACLALPCSLGYGEVVADGFYDIFGDFPEVCEGPNQFPALADLRKVRTGSGDVREVRPTRSLQIRGRARVGKNG